MPGWFFHELAECAAVAVLSFVLLSAFALFLKAERATWKTDGAASKQA